MNHSKEFKPMKYTWIDMQQPNKGYHFKNIYESSESINQLK